MNTEQGFAIWITGLPASGKSSLAGALVKELRGIGVRVVVLESDALRQILTPNATYRPEERDTFYHALVLIGQLLTQQGINVIFDATANRRAYRDEARSRIEKFVEIFVDCPLEVCKSRDPKGIYAKAASGKASSVPGVQSSYEPPVRPELRVDASTSPQTAAAESMNVLKKLSYTRTL